MSTLNEQIRRTEQRWQSSKEQRERRCHHVELLREGKGGDWRQVDEPGRVLRRLVALGEHELAGEAIASTATRRAAPEGAAPAPEVAVLERILAENELLGITFLLEGALVSRAVGRVAIRSGGRLRGFGTGFLVSPRLMMTNNHVLASAATAAGSAVQFNFFESIPGRPNPAIEFALRPGELFLTDPRLDYTLVAVAPESDEGVALSTRGWIPLIAESGKSIVGERVNIIQHPGGEPQQVAVHQNEIVDVVDAFLHYSTDTQRGSSGSPVLNDEWELAALHHAGVPDRDDQRRILLVDDTPWDGSAATASQIRWVANEGTRISRVVAHLRERLAGGRAEHLRLFEESFEPCGHDFENLRLLTDGVESLPIGGGRGGESGLSGIAGPRVDASGAASWVLPLTVSVSLPGAAAPGTVPSASAAAPDADTGPAGAPAEPGAGAATVDTAALDSALDRLREHEDEPYYDEAEDAEAIAAYYPEDLLRASPPRDLFSTLATLVEETHTTRLSYKSARLDHLYPWIDLREDRRLVSVYSGKGFEPEEIIRADLEVQALHEARLRERLTVESMDPEAIESFLDDLEAAHPFNCEHVVPQSWFGEAQPMKADLHHLFTCEWGCNSFRGNFPYFDFPEEEEAVRDACGRREEEPRAFEPDAGKGAVARATLYFLLRYPGLIGDEARELQAERLPVLLGWHRAFPVDTYERHRNAEIFAVQGNRNPFIDHPELAERIDLLRGFGPLL